MWKLDKGSYYNFENGKLLSVIIERTEFDKNANTYGLGITTSDDGYAHIGQINKDEFVEALAKALCESALAENKDFDWWMANGNTWWYNNTVTVKS